MKILVTAASRHGSTQMIGDCIREELEASRCRAVLIDPDMVVDLSEFDAVVLGSAVYKGRWLKSARKLAQRLEGQLRGKPVWLFSSGPIGDPATLTTASADALALMQRIGAREHRVFAGRLARELLGIGERFSLRGAGAPSGDYRSWLEVGRWARSIAASVHEQEPVAGPETHAA